MLFLFFLFFISVKLSSGAVLRLGFGWRQVELQYLGYLSAGFN